jgi:hypothetical protein
MDLFKVLSFLCHIQAEHPRLIEQVLGDLQICDTTAKISQHKQHHIQRQGNGA